MRHSHVGAYIAIVGATLLASCASEQYQYVPADRPANNDRRTNQAIYSVPQDSPTGSVRVSTLGIVDIKPPDGSKSVHALHIKLAVSNERDRVDWKINPMDQVVALPNQPEIRPLVVGAEATNPQDVDIKPGQLRVVDLYFPMPEPTKSPKTLPEFDFHWQVQTGQRLVKDTTLFDRIQIPDAPAVIYPYGPYPYAMGWGPVWWGGVAYP